MRATSESGRHGSTWNVRGSGWAMTSCSRSLEAPSSEEPSSPTPSSSADSSSETGIEMLLSRPSTSMNHRRTNLHAPFLDRAQHELAVTRHRRRRYGPTGGSVIGPPVLSGSTSGRVGCVSCCARVAPAREASSARNPHLRIQGVATSIAPMSPRILPAADAFWRPSNQMGVLNTDLAKQLEARRSARGCGGWRPGRPRRSTATRRRPSSTSCSRAPAGSASATSCTRSRRCRACSSSPRRCARSSTTPRPTRCGSSSARRRRSPTRSR